MSGQQRPCQVPNTQVVWVQNHLHCKLLRGVRDRYEARTIEKGAFGRYCTVQYLGHPEFCLFVVKGSSR